MNDAGYGEFTNSPLFKGAFGFCKYNRGEDASKLYIAYICIFCYLRRKKLGEFVDLRKVNIG